MSGVLRPIRPEGLMHVGEFEGQEAAVIAQYALLSDPLMLGTYGSEILCVVGLIPPTLLSDQAYIWLWTDEAASRHRVVFGRWARRFIHQALQRYSLIRGHCARSNWKWLHSLGAEIADVQGDIFEFEIRA